ncbi:MAG TPA: HNH endonuclease signature motif containing protein [Trebonia sp.]|nr:HNH endonuclease signature motif containing protein [Trebonia sp.]
MTFATDGTAVAHGCASGQHPWQGNAPPPSGSPPGAQLFNLLRRLNVTLEPVARDTCDHRNAEHRYVPSRKLKHMVRARNQLCTAPACNAQAIYCDLDHTDPYPDGPSDQCNLNPKCRRHHRTKQAPGWRVTQPTPDTAVWTTPSGRTHTTTATVYDL